VRGGFSGEKPVAKLAFWDTVNGTYRFVFTHPLTLLRAGWLYGLLDALNFAVSRTTPAEPRLTPVALATTVLFFGASIAWNVALTRAILLREDTWSAALQFRQRQWRLLGVMLLLLLILIAIGVVAAVLGVLAFHFGGTAVKALFVVGAILGSIALLAAASRINLIGPAIATDDPAKAIRAAWHRGRGNTGRLFFGAVLMVLPVLIVGVITGGFGGLLFFFATHGELSLGAWVAQLGFGGRVVLGLAQAVIQVAVAALNVTFYATAYRQIGVNWSPPPALAAALLDT
jgi:hypothetical protein